MNARNAPPETTHHAFSAMGCPCSFVVEGMAPNSALEIMADAEAEVRRLDDKYSDYVPGNWLALLQQSAQRPAGVSVDPETAALLDVAHSWYLLSDGAFDITCGALTHAWRKLDGIPSRAQLCNLQARSGWSRVGWQRPVLRLPPGMQLDLGAIVKEYAADRAALLLRRGGARSGVVDLGGDLHVLGPHADGSGWNVGIQESEPGSRQAQALVSVGRGGVATSGDYERYKEVNGVRFGHVVDARTGWPVSGVRSVSVCAPTTLVAGGMATLAMLAGPVAGRRLLRRSGFSWLMSDGDSGVDGTIAA